MNEISALGYKANAAHWQRECERLRSDLMDVASRYLTGLYRSDPANEVAAEMAMIATSALRKPVGVVGINLCPHCLQPADQENGIWHQPGCPAIQPDRESERA